MSRVCCNLIAVLALSVSACMVGMIKPSQEVTVQNTGTDPNVGLQLIQQKDFIFVINSKGHPAKIPGTSWLTNSQNLYDSEYTRTLRKSLLDSFFALKKRVSSVEEIDPDARPYISILESHSWDPCVMYISFVNLEKKEYSSGTPGMWMGNVYSPGTMSTDYYLKITFTIQIIFYGKYQDQYSISKEIRYPDSNEDIYKYLDYNFRNILDEFYNLRIGN